MAAADGVASGALFASYAVRRARVEQLAGDLHRNGPNRLARPPPHEHLQASRAVATREPRAGPIPPGSDISNSHHPMPHARGRSAHGRRQRQSARRRPLRHQTVQDLVGLDRLSGGQGGRARAGTIPSRRHGARVHVPFRPHTRRDVKSAYSAFLNRWAVARVRCAVLLHTCPVRAHSRFRDLK